MKEIHSIQYLRAIAALMVVFFHIRVQLARFGYDGTWPTMLASGVDVFFVISGFIMWVTTYGNGISARQFIARRLARIVPLYWLLTSFTVFVMVFFPSLVHSTTFDIIHVIKSYLFIPAKHPAAGDLSPVLVQGWTLNYEMFFYAIFAICLLLPTRYRALAMIGSLAAIVSLGFFFRQPLTLGAFYTSGIILEFAFGILIGVLVTSERTFRAPISGTLFVLGVVGMILSVFYTAPRLVSWGIPAMLIVLGAVMFERSHRIKRYKLFHTLGDASYSLYLSHGIILSAFGLIWRKLNLTSIPANFVLFTLVSPLLVSLVAVFLYRAVERPLIRAFGRRRLPSPA